MQLILRILKPYRKYLIINAVTDAIGMFTLLLMPYIMSRIVDGGIAVGDFDAVIKSGGLMLLFSAFSLISRLIANKSNSMLTTGFTADMSNATFQKINRLTYAQYSKIGPSSLLTRVTDDIWNLEGIASTIVYTAVTVPIMIIGSAVLAFSADWALATIFMVVIPPVMVIVLLFMRPLNGMWDKADKYIDEQNKIVRERLSGLRVVRAFNNEEKEHKRAKFATEEMSKYMIRANVRAGYIEPIAMLLLNLATVVMVAVGGIRAEQGLLARSGDIISIVQYVGLLSGALINLSWTLSWLPKVRVSIRRINEIHAMPDEDILPSKEQSLSKNRGENGYEIALNGVSFCYPDSSKPTLKDITLNIKEGEQIAIIGGTGSGKTTLARVIMGLYPPTEGSLTLGGKDYREIGTRGVRDRFSIALQKPMIFEGSIRNNLKMGSPEALGEEMLSALSDCAMDGYIREHEDGLDHFLVGGGQNLSGGQKQRLNMARTVLRKADIYLFDDSYSALDFLTESIIKKNLAVRLKGKSQIVITQRVSTAMKAERIFVIDGGKIIAVGSHGELIKGSSLYREICISQLGKEAIGGEINE